MKVYLEKVKTDNFMYGMVPDLTQGNATIVDSFEISEEEGLALDRLFVDQTNAVCDASLDLGDYQYYNSAQCADLYNWLEEATSDESISILNDFFLKLKVYLQYAIDNNTGIAIEL